MSNRISSTPPLFGIIAFTAHKVSGITAFQVSCLNKWLCGPIDKGGYLNRLRLMTEGRINIVYGVLALIAVVMMFIPKLKS